jgi:hypothetical protein
MGAGAEEALGAVKSNGIAYGFDGDDPFPTARCTSDPRFQIRGWGWMEDVNLILSFIANDSPVVADFFIDESFLSLKAGEVYQVKAGRPTRLHSVAVVGYDAPAGWALVQNSFGTGWADGGFGRVAIGTGNFLTPRGAYRVAA